MATRITLKTVNNELARRGHRALLAKGNGYFYFRTGDAADWLDRTVQVPTLNALTLEQWIAEFERLKKLNRQIAAARPVRGSKEKPAKRTSRSQTS